MICERTTVTIGNAWISVTAGTSYNLRHITTGSSPVHLEVWLNGVQKSVFNDSMIHQKLIERRRVLDFSLFREPAGSEADIEDLFPETIYVDAFNTAYSKELNGRVVDIAALGAHPRIVERLNKWLEANGVTLLKAGGFNHYRVAQALLPKLNNDNLSATDLERFEKLLRA